MQTRSNIFNWLMLYGALIFIVGLPAVSWAGEPAPLAPETIGGAINVNAEQFLTLAESTPDLIVIDARIEMDRTQGYIEGSVSLPDLKTNCDSLANIIPQKNHPTLFYCNGIRCGRSINAIEIALDCGYSNIYWFRGGFEEWRTKGYPYLNK